MGIVSSFLDGVDRAETRTRRKKDEAYLDSERTHLVDRRGVLEGREDRDDTQGQQDRTHTIERRGVTEGREDVQFADTRVDRTHTLARRPIEDKQADETHSSNMATAATTRDATRTNIAATNQAMSQRAQLFTWELKGKQREERIAQLNDDLFKLGVAPEQVAHDTAIAQHTLADVHRQAAQTNSATPYEKWYNANVADGHNIRIAQATEGKLKGTWFAVQVDDKGMPLETAKPVSIGKSLDEIGKYAETMVNPDVYREHLLTTLQGRAQIAQAGAEDRAKNPKQHTETISDADGEITQVDLDTNTATKVRGADGGVVRGIVSGRAGTNPGKEANDFYGKTLRSLLKPDITGKPPSAETSRAAEAEAMRLTRNVFPGFQGADADPAGIGGGGGTSTQDDPLGLRN